MSDGDALLRAILADPADDTARLVYADWLQENGEPERAEFVRVQIALDHLRPSAPCVAYILGVCCRSMDCPICPLHRRESALMLEWGREWWSDSWLAVYGDDLSRTSPHAMTAIARRGFVDEVRCPAESWLANADAITARHPIERVTLTTWPDARLTSVNAYRQWKRQLEWGADVMWTWQAEWPRIAFTLPTSNVRDYLDIDPAEIASR